LSWGRRGKCYSALSAIGAVGIPVAFGACIAVIVEKHLMFIPHCGWKGEITMEAFTAKGISEEWVITRNDHTLDKIVSKTTERMIIRKHTTITYLRGGMALPAFYAEKKKALAKGLEISNFDSSVTQPKIYEVKAVVHPKRVKILNRYVSLDELK